MLVLHMIWKIFKIFALFMFLLCVWFFLVERKISLNEIFRLIEFSASTYIPNITDILSKQHPIN